LAADQTSPDKPSLWVVSDGKQGHEALALGVAHALRLTPQLFQAPAGGLYGALAPWASPPPGQVGSKGKLLAPPWPDILIAVGRKAIPYGVAVRRASRGGTFTIALQNPVISPHAFDLVWAPAHDRLAGPNVVSTVTTPHRLSGAAIKAEAQALQPSLAALPQRRVAVLVGGPNQAYRFAEMEARALCAQLDALGDDIGFLVTTSRRTPAEVIEALRAWASRRPSILWSGEGPNPYLGFLGAAQAIVVTGDSVNMAGEAAATGKPVYVFALPVEDSARAAKFERFHAALAKTGATRPLVGQLQSWTYPAVDANAEIGAAIRARLAARRGTA
jgi:mitochondrial fission protein ELM1